MSVPSRESGLDRVLQEVAAERRRQDEKWGADRNHVPADWLAILTEEVGEAAEQVCRQIGGDAVSRDIHALREELVQVAAVAVAFIESMDRYYLGDRDSAEARAGL